MRSLSAGIVAVMAIGVSSVFAQSSDGWTPPADSESQIEELLNLPVDAELASELEATIARLGAPSYKQREAATLRLREIGPASFAKLQSAYRTSDEFEMRLRIETIVRDTFLNKFVFGLNGFLGISQSQVPIVHDDEGRIQEGYVGIRIQRVIKDTSAEKSGLQVGDVIIALNGEPVPSLGRRTTAAFGDSIRVHPPGSRLLFTILREAKQFDLEVTIGARPKLYYGSNQGTVFQMLEHYRELFDVFWEKHFHGLQPQRPGGE
jgi:membrane-associated protease RseP (regulator of RpoE activity)